MRQLNVRSAQIDECIQKSLFAIPYRPQYPELQLGELLLLQLVKDEARQLRQEYERINFALVSRLLEEDHDSIFSQLHWRRRKPHLAVDCLRLRHRSHPAFQPGRPSPLQAL